MRKQLIAVAGLAVLSTPAFASKARMTALGQDTGGSHYVEDQRNTFLNPAHYNSFSNFVITEWGNNDEANADAEGGFARQSGNFVYSAYLGNDAARTSNVADAETFLAADNNLDLSIAGDAGIKWGATLQYGANEDQVLNGSGDVVSKEGDFVALKAGVGASNWAAYAHFTLKDEVTGSGAQDTLTDADDSWEKDNLALGGHYNHGDWTFFVDWGSSEVTLNDADATAAESVTDEVDTLRLGVAHMVKLDDKATMWMALAYNTNGAEFGEHAADATDESNTSNLNLLVAMEAKANSWLTLRGSVNQDVLVSDSEVVDGSASTTLEDSGFGTTTVAAGASLTFGKLMVDGTLAGASEDAAELRLDRLVGNVAVHYWF